MAETVIDTFITEYGFRTDTRALRALDRNIDRIRNRLNSVSRGFTFSGGVLTAALFGVGRGMVEFDKEMNRLQRDTNATEEEMAAMRARVIELGSSSDYTTISVNDAARALRELRKGGLDFEQGMAALPDVLNLVAATEIDVGDAATKTAKIMKGFGLEVEDIPRIHDLVAHAQVKTGITAAEMIDTLLRVAPTARAANIEIEDMASALAILVDQGQISDRAATSLERTLVMLAKAEVLPPLAKSAFKELGIDLKTVQDLMAQGKYIETMKLLAEAGLNVSTASRIFGDDGQRAALTLAGAIPELEAFRASLDDIDGAMKKQALTMNQGLSGSWAAFMSSLSAARESLGDAGLRGWLERAANRVRELVEQFTALPEPTRKWIGMLLASGPALLLFAGGLRTISFLLGGLSPAIRGATWLLAAFLGTAGKPGLALRGFAAMQLAGVGAMTAIRRAKRRLDLAIAFNEPLAVMQLAGVGAMTAIRRAKRRLDLAIAFNEPWAAVKAAPAAFRAAALRAFSLIGVGARVMWVAISGPAAPVVAGLILLAALLVAAWRPVSTFFLGLWQGLVAGSGRVGDAFGRLLDALGPVGDGIRTVFRGVGHVWTWLVNLFGDHTDAGRGWGEAIIDGAVATIDKLTAAIETIKTLFGWIKRLENPVDENSWLGRVTRAGGIALRASTGTLRPGNLFGGGGEDDGPRPEWLLPPPAPPALAAAGGGGAAPVVNRSTSITVERIEVNAEGADADELSARLGDSLREQLHNTAEDFDSDVVR